MGKNGLKPPVFGAVKDYVRDNVGKTVSIKEIFGCGAIGRNSYACYLCALKNAGYVEVVKGKGLSDPESEYLIVKAMPENYTSVLLKREIKLKKNN